MNNTSPGSGPGSGTESGAKEHGEGGREEKANRLFARVEMSGALAGMLVAILGLAVYVSGIVPPFIPIDELVVNWGLGVDEFVLRTNQPAGWSWLHRLGYGDTLAFLGLALLAGVVVACYAALLPVMIKSGERLFSLLVFLQLIVFALAASGWLTGH